MAFFRSNLDTKGRVTRGVGALAMGAAAILVWPQTHAASIALAFSSAFVAFEALRGWCALRACGLKTRF
jgi:hypothetical protein